jgi:hypothetical protein
MALDRPADGGPGWWHRAILAPRRLDAAAPLLAGRRTSADRMHEMMQDTGSARQEFGAMQ